MTGRQEHGSARAEEARQARDVMAFGQEIGRILSDGRIVGRAEPFAKVFPSSRLVKKVAGLAAWGVLEDIALDARLDDRGRLVAETNVRRIADNLGLNKDTVSKHLRTLREYGFVLQEEERDTGSGRYDSCRYVLDPSACVERFTVTPPARQTPRSSPCPGSSDTVPAAPVSEATGHGGTGHGEVGQLCRDVVVRREQQQHRVGGGRDGGLTERLCGLGVAGRVAGNLLAHHPVERIRDVVEAAEAQSLRKPAGWVVSALRDGWDVTDVLASHRAAQARQRAEAAHAEADSRRAEDEQQRRRRAEGWAAAVSAALDDLQLLGALRQVTTPTAGIGRRSVPVARAQLLAWAVAVHRDDPAACLAAALHNALAAGPAPVAGGLAGEIPEAPASPARDDLIVRIGACLNRLTEPTGAAAPTAGTSPTRQEQR